MSNFRFWVPLDSIEKATDEKTGKTVMKLAGIASTKREDTDKESLDPNGFDVSYLKERGIVNWNHNKSPDAIIGEPTKVEFRKEGLFIESELYPDSDLANKVYELATTLKKNSKKRRLGYSIEGKATLRDPLNPLSVKKAMITNVALTMSPKNPDSIVDIIKGEFHELSDEEIIKSNINPLSDFDMMANGGEVKYLVDITKEDGTRILVDEDYRIKIDKALSTDSTSGKAVTRESLEGAPKILAGKDDNVGEIKYLSKAEVIEGILENNSVISLEKANEIYQTLNELTMSNTKITSDLLEKALKTIGLEPKTVDKLSKGDDPEDDDMEDEGEEVEESIEAKKKKDKISKGVKGKKDEKKEPEPEEDEDEEEEEMTEGEDEGEDDDEEIEEKPKKKVGKKATKKEEKEDDDEEEEMEKSVSPEFLKSLGVALKATYDLVEKSNTLIKSQSDMLSEQTKLIKSLNDTIGAQNEKITLLEENMEKSLDSLGELKSAPGERKAITKAQPVQRNFEKGEVDELKQNQDLEKSNNANQLSISADKSKVMNILDEMTFEKGFDNEFGAALTLFESSGQIGNAKIVERIKAEKGITLVA